MKLILILSLLVRTKGKIIPRAMRRKKSSMAPALQKCEDSSRFLANSSVYRKLGHSVLLSRFTRFGLRLPFKDLESAPSASQWWLLEAPSFHRRVTKRVEEDNCNGSPRSSINLARKILSLANSWLRRQRFLTKLASLPGAKGVWGRGGGVPPPRLAW